MIITSNLDSPDDVPASPQGTLLAAAIDVEWSKNYRVRGGNVPFCYSVTWLTLPHEHAGRAPPVSDTPPPMSRTQARPATWPPAPTVPCVTPWIMPA